MKTAMSWRSLLLGAALSAMGGAPMHEGLVQDECQQEQRYINCSGMR